MFSVLSFAFFFLGEPVFIYIGKSHWGVEEGGGMAQIRK